MQHYDYVKQCTVQRPLQSHPNKPIYDITFALRFLRGKQMAACEQITVAYVPW